MYIVTITDKATHAETILTAFENENKALKMCESWGWTYDDGKAAYFMAYEELSDGGERLAESVDDIANLDGLAMFEVVED